MEHYFQKCNLAKTWIRNPKMWEKILEKMPNSKSCTSCGVMEECKKVIKYNIEEILNPESEKSV